MNLVNGKVSSSISIFDRGFLYGDSVFETILVLNKNPQNIKLHLSRLKKGCNHLKIKNLDFKLLQRHINKALSDEKDCVLNINITRGTVINRGYNIKLAPKKPNIILTTGLIPKFPKEYVNSGINTKFSSSKVIDNEGLSKIKHSNRIDQVIATKEISKNFPELIMCDQKNNIIEGISSNIFFVKGKVFYTPKISRSGVEGVMKSFIIKNLKKNKYKIIEKIINRKEIKNYDGAFFCNSVRLIWNIKSIKNFRYKKNIHISKLTKIINDEIFK